MERDNSYLIGNQFAKGTKPNITAFKKGDTPWNKGKKGIHLSSETEFKKGQKGINWKPVGSVTIRKDKNKKPRRWIKLDEPNIWVEYAKFIWIKNHGEIPYGFLIHHIDEDTLNDNIENFAMVTRKAHINLHRHSLEKGKALKRK